MKLLVSVAAAAVVATMLHTAVGAQAPQTPPQPPPSATQPPPQTPAQPPAPAPAPKATMPAPQAEQQITLVGCIQKESDYRAAQDKGRGGAAGTGAGTGDEFILTNASMATQGLKSEATAADTAYELTGSGEGKAKDFIGKRVQITGKLKAAEVGAAGRPTGGATAGAPPSGVDVASKDLKLRELEVTSVSAATGTCTP
jgi:hypothetical protein